MGLYDNVMDAVKTPEQIEEERLAKIEKEKKEKAEKEAYVNSPAILNEDSLVKDSPKIEDKVEEATAEVEETPEDTDMLEGLIEKAQSSADLIPELDKYESDMKALDGELAEKEAALSKGFKDEESDARLSSYITKGIELAAQMFAAHRGVKSKLSAPLDTGEKERMQRLERELNNNRRILRSRISQGKSLLGDMYSKKERKEGKAERAEDRAETAEQNREIRNAEIDRYNVGQRTRYDKAVSTRQRQFKDQFRKKKRKDQYGFLDALGIDRSQRDVFMNDNWTWSSEPHMDQIDAYLDKKARQEIGEPPVEKGKIPGEGESTTPSTQPPSATDPKRERALRYIGKYEDDPAKEANVRALKAKFNIQ